MSNATQPAKVRVIYDQSNDNGERIATDTRLLSYEGKFSPRNFVKAMTPEICDLLTNSKAVHKGRKGWLKVQLLDAADNVLLSRKSETRTWYKSTLTDNRAEVEYSTIRRTLRAWVSF